jgi:hypothetical protein
VTLGYEDDFPSVPPRPPDPPSRHDAVIVRVDVEEIPRGDGVPDRKTTFVLDCQHKINAGVPREEPVPNVVGQPRVCYQTAAELQEPPPAPPRRRRGRRSSRTSA